MVKEEIPLRLMPKECLGQAFQDVSADVLWASTMGTPNKT